MPHASSPISLARKTADIERGQYRSATNRYRKAEQEYYLLLRQSTIHLWMRALLPEASETLKQAYYLEQLAYLRYRAARAAATREAVEAEGRPIAYAELAVLS